MDVAYMLDESVNIKVKIPAMIQSVVNVQVAYAQALLIDREALREAQETGCVIQAEEVLLDAYRTDVRPLLAAMRDELGLDPDPIAAYLRSGYQEKIVAERGVSGSGSGYPGA